MSYAILAATPAEAFPARVRDTALCSYAPDGSPAPVSAEQAA